MLHDPKKANGQTTKAKQAKAHTKPEANGQQIAFDEAVAEGKEIVLAINAAEDRQLRLGELADKLEPKYGKGTIKKWAKKIGIANCTADRYRTVWRAWKEILAPGPNSIPAPSYAVCRELAKHPDAAEIIRKNPEITKSEARERMQKYKEEHEGKKNNKSSKGQADGFDKDNKRWCKALVVQANAAIKFAATRKKCTSEQGRRLAEALEPHLVKTVEKAGEDWVALGAWFRELIAEGRDNTSPKSPPAEPIQVGVA